MIESPVHPEFEQYAELHSKAEHSFLQELHRETYLKTMYPRMISGHLQGKFLEMISRLTRPRRILEIGTFTGYSTICLALGLANGGLIHTIDSNPEPVAIGQKYFEKAGVHQKIIIHTGNALDMIPQIDELFDLVFIDADKENYLNYYNLVFDKVRSGGLILADNAFWDGKVLDGDAADRETRGIIGFNKALLHDESVDNLLLTLRDGLMMILKK